MTFGHASALLHVHRKLLIFKLLSAALLSRSLAEPILYFGREICICAMRMLRIFPLISAFQKNPESGPDALKFPEAFCRSPSPFPAKIFIWEFRMTRMSCAPFRPFERGVTVS